MEKVKVGIFWVCDSGEKAEIIYDFEEFSLNGELKTIKHGDKEFKDEFLLYDKPHSAVWEKLSKKFFNGKYSSYAYNDFPRGRVTYDAEENLFIIDYDKKLAPARKPLKSALIKLFDITDYIMEVDHEYVSTKGKFNRRVSNDD